MYYQQCPGTDNEINNYPGKHTQITRDIEAVQFVNNSKIMQTMYQKLITYLLNIIIIEFVYTLDN